MEPIYPWKRFWIRPDGIASLADDGYLVDPEEHPYWNTHAVPWEKIAEIPCLVLLGEPGIGKSKAIEQIGLTVEAEERLYEDLSGYGDQLLLHAKTFGSPKFQKWLTSDTQLELVLDGFDECQIHFEQLAAWLASELKKCPTCRMRLRIACRTAEWPAHLADTLPAIWGKERFGAYELAALRRCDVELAATLEQLDVAAFLSVIDARGAVPLAVNPVTLKFLIKEFRDSGSLPSERAELYRRGLLRLCEEQNPTRRASGAVPTLSPDQIMSVAERIAAGQMFGKRAMVPKEERADDTRSDELGFDELRGDDLICGVPTVVTTSMIREALGSGVFSGRAGGRMGFAHWSYAEYLAARFCVTRKLSVEQIGDLIFHPDASERPQIVPQLTEIAAWLAAIHPDLLSRIADNDPQVLLRGKIAMSEPSRSKVTASLLKLADAGKLLERDDDFWTRRRYGSLKHDAIAAQLEPYIRAKNRSLVAREIAVEIAEDCDVSDLGPALADVVLDATEEYRIRHRASYAIARIGDSASKGRLRPFLDPAADADPYDTFKGNALRALWPDQLSVSEVLARLTPPQRENFGGSYSFFVSDELAKELRPYQLPDALAWLYANSDTPPMKWYSALRLAEGIVHRACESLQEPLVLERLTDVVASRVVKFENPFAWQRHNHNEDAPIGAESRRKIAVGVVERLSTRDDAHFTCLTVTRLVVEDDLEWAIEQFERSDGEALQAAWAGVIGAILSNPKPAHVDFMLAAMLRSSRLAARFKNAFEPIALDSPLATELREKRRRWQELTQRRPKPQVIHAPIQEIVTQHLQKFVSGDLDAWWKMQADLTLQADSDDQDWHLAYRTDLTSFPNWNLLGSEVQQEVGNHSLQFIRSADPETDSWLGTDSFRRAAMAGVRSLRFLLDQRPDLLDQVARQDWERWATALLALASTVHESEEDDCSPLIAHAYQSAPDAVIDAFLRVLNVQRLKQRDLPVIGLMQRAWDSRIDGALNEWLRSDHVLDTTSASTALKFLFARGEREEALASGFHLIAHRGNGEAARSTAIAVAHRLLEEAPTEAWPKLWPTIKREASFGCSVLTQLAKSHEQRHGDNIALKLVENDAAELYAWMERCSPDDGDPAEDESDHFSDRKQIGYFRNAIISALRDRGTVAAVQALRSLAKKMPEDGEWLMQVALAAERNRLRQQWPGVAPSTVYAMAKDANVRVIESGAQLMTVVLGSLRRFEHELHGVTAAIEDLWNENAPKDENALSNRLKRHLDRDLRPYFALANRESEVRRGEKTDIYVDALCRQALAGRVERISLIIEVKGCWHPKLKTAMKDQLKDRYLHGKTASHGLYLVGWFCCAAWKRAKHRATHARWSPAKAKAFFREQALKLSDESVTIEALVLDARRGEEKRRARSQSNHRSMNRICAEHLGSGMSTGYAAT